MKIYTSYWAQVRNFPTTLIGLNTTIFPPRWRQLGQDNRGVWVIDCPPLKPGHNCDGLCNGKCAPKHPQDCKFLYEYKRQLDDIDFDIFFQKLQKLHDSISEDMSKDIDFAFIFFEKYDNPCSERWAVQKWLREHGCEISEWHIEQ
jgi:hypothetical protein